MLHFRVLDAAGFGVAQHRERLIVVGTEPSANFLFPRPLHGPDSPTQDGYLSASEAIADLDDPNEAVASFPGKYGALLAAVPPGENYKFFTEEMGHPEPKFAWRSRFSDFLYKAHPDQPVRTIVANQGSYSGPFHWKGRRFTSAEFARLQSFPPDYLFPASHAVAVKQIGNSVAPRFAYHVAMAIGQQLYGLPHQSELLHESQTLSIDRRKAEKARQTQRRATRVSIEPCLFDIDTQTLTARGRFTENLRFCTPRSACRSSTAAPDWLHAKLTGKLSKGEWRFGVEDLKPGQFAGFNFTLEVNFGRPLAGRFSRIVTEGHLRSANRFALVWDAIHRLIKRETSFESLHPLYGHFTEPYPKFRTIFSGRDNKAPELVALYSKLADYSFSQDVRPLKELKGLSPKRDPIAGVKELRSLGWDFRVHQTNRSIPVGMFRSCYPFALPIDAATFVAWVEVGDHRTADLSAIGATPA
jgi:DNA (cytosine-5)-methyltransferase 1